MTRETQLHDALKHEMRRVVLQTLLDDTEPWTLEDLAVLVSQENGTGRDYHTALIDLHHRHLPKLEQLELIERVDERSWAITNQGITTLGFID